MGRFHSHFARPLQQYITGEHPGLHRAALNMVPVCRKPALLYPSGPSAQSPQVGPFLRTHIMQHLLQRPFHSVHDSYDPGLWRPAGQLLIGAEFGSGHRALRAPPPFVHLPWVGLHHRGACPMPSEC